MLNNKRAISPAPMLALLLAAVICSVGLSSTTPPPSYVTGAPTAATPAPSPLTESIVDVIVVGAGATGLTVGTELQRQNASFVILEALDRVGGRVWSVPDPALPGKFREHGASWIHGAESNFILWPLKEALGLVGTHTNYRDTTLIDFDGLVRVEIDEAEKQFWFDRIEHAFVLCDATQEALWDFAASTGYAVTDVDLDISLMECLVDKGYFNASHETQFPEYDVSEETLANATRWRRLANLFAWLECDFEYAEPAPLVSTMWGFPVNPDMQDSDFHVTGGFKEIFETLATPIASHIKLEHLVVEIDWGSSPIDLVAVRTEHGAVFHAPKVVLAIPLGALQGAVAEDPRAPLRFVPALPEWKTTALEKFVFARYAKITALFETNFWGDREILFLAREDTGDLPWAINLDHASYYPGSCSLQFHVAYDDAVKYEETVDIDDTKDAIVEMLAIYLDMATGDVPRPISVDVTKWGIDPLFNGSYSDWPFGFFEDDHADMVDPVDDKLYFSGEHTDQAYYGFLHGGITSGARTARQLFASSYSYSYSYDDDFASFSY